MTFLKKLLLCSLIPAMLFVAALAASVWGLMRTQSEFSDYLSREQAYASGLTQMYAQGLQMGQALRNIILDPANPKAYANFDKANEAFDAAYDRTVTAAPSERGAAIQTLHALRQAQIPEQRKVIALVRQGDSAAAIHALNVAETPAWRHLREPLLEQIDSARAASTQTHARTEQRAHNATRTAVGLAVLAMISAVVLTTMLGRTVSRELGADPADVGAALRRIADGDLTRHERSSGDGLGLMRELERTRLQLRGLVETVRVSTDQISTASAEIAIGNQDLSARTEQTASNLQETASSMEQLTGAVQRSASTAVQANQLAATAAEVAERGGHMVARVVGTMNDIDASSRRIGDIIGVIDGIAFQTNILALNAAVEAARAGEQGRGFAVVAGEVRTLAQRSAEAAREIKTLIGTSVEQVDTGARLVADAGSTMQDIVDAVRRVAAMIGEVTASAGEQSDGIGQVNLAVNQLDQMTQQNAALVEESAAAAASLRDQASKLSDVLGVFRTDGPATTRQPA